MSKLLNVQAYCERCKKTEQIAVDLSSGDIQQHLSSHSGVYPISLTHDDHSIVVFIDGNGAARRVNYIDLVNQRMESAVSSQASIILKAALQEKIHGTMFVISQNPKFKDFIIALGQVLNNNLSFDEEFSIESTKDHVLYKIRNYSIYLGPFDSFAQSLMTKNDVFFYELSNLDLPLKKIKNRKSLFLLYNLQEMIKQGTQGKLNDFILNYKPDGIYDFRTSEDIAEAIFKALEGIYVS